MKVVIDGGCSAKTLDEAQKQLVRLEKLFIGKRVRFGIHVENFDTVYNFGQYDSGFLLLSKRLQQSGINITEVPKITQKKSSNLRITYTLEEVLCAKQ